VNQAKVCLRLKERVLVKNLLGLIKSFFIRLGKGQLVETAYLTLHYCYIGIYDFKHKTRFMNSAKPQIEHQQFFATGNFPCNPRIVRKLAQGALISPDDKILDVGCGSGLLLHVLYQEGYENLYGLEISKEAFLLAKSNLDGIAAITEGNALNHDLTIFDGIFFFNPFSDPLQSRFLSSLPPNIRFVITLNEGLEAEVVLRSKGFTKVFCYTNYFYRNFSGKVYRL
jgi:SAM-dependent methyltransferase